MADLRNYNEITQLSEDMEYPDGYNVIEIIGMGDTRQTRIFPTVTITGPDQIISNGIEVAELTIEIYDPNSDNPFQLEPNTFESASLIGPQEMTVSNWIVTLHAVYEDEAKTKPIPTEYLTFSQNKIRILDGWRAVGASWDGLRTQEAWVEYDGQYTVAVEDGLQVVDRWWVYAGDDENQTEADVKGTIFVDAAGLVECTSSEIPIPNAPGQSTSVKVYYRPDTGESGIAYMNAAYDSAESLWTMEVIAGAGFANVDITLDADPSGISPGQYSELSAIVTYSTSGAPILSGHGQFYIYSGRGRILGASAPFGRTNGQQETVYTGTDSAGLRNSFSVQYPIIRITSITAVAGGFTWNGQVVVDGNSVTLVGQEFPEDTIPINVTYDWGGQAVARYHATGDAIGDTVYVGFRYGGHNRITEIDITEAGASGNKGSLRISPEDSSLSYGESTLVKLYGTEPDGSGGTGTVNIRTVNGGTCASAVLGTKAFVGAEGSINSTKTFTVDVPPASVSQISNIQFLAVNYTAASVDGTTVTINETFPVTAGTLTLNYTGVGYGETTFIAPSSDRTCYIVGRWKEADPATAIITVDASGAGGTGTLSMSAEEGSVDFGGTTKIHISATDGAGSPGTGTVSLSNIGGSTPGSVSLGTWSFTNAKGTINGKRTFTVAHPIDSLGSVTGITFLGAGYTATAIDGTTVTVSSDFPTVTGEVSLNYTAGGYAVVTFTAPTSAPRVPFDCYVTGTWSTADPAAVVIQVGQNYSSQLDLNADPSSVVAQDGFGVLPKHQSTVTARAQDSSGVGVSSLRWHLYHQYEDRAGSFTGLSRISSDIVEEASIQSVRTVRTQSYISSVTDVTVLSISYPVASFSEDVILLGADLPIASGPATVTYTPDGAFSGTYTSGTGANNAYITASFTDSLTGEEQVRTVEIKVTTDTGGPAPKPLTIELVLEEGSDDIEAGDTATFTATVKEGGDVSNGHYVTYSKEDDSTPGELEIDNYYTGTDGTSVGHLVTQRTDRAGRTTIIASTGDVSASVEVKIGEAGGGTRHSKSYTITGVVRPDKTYTLTGGATIGAWGAAEFVDEFWCTNLDPTQKDSKFVVFFPVPATLRTNGAKIVDISVSDPDWSAPKAWISVVTHAINYDNVRAVEVPLLFDFRVNPATTQSVFVGDKADPTKAVVGATVSIAGQTQVTNSLGIAEFTGLTPGSYDISITHPNYLDNRPGLSGGASAADTDPTNDTFEVTDYSSLLWRLDETAVSLTVTFTIEDPPDGTSGV